MPLDVEAFRDIFVTDDSKKINLDSGLHYDLAYARSAWELAGKGIDVVTSKKLSEIAGKKIFLFRSSPDLDPNDPSLKQTITDEMKALRPLVMKKATGSLTAAESEKLESNIERLSATSGMDKEFLSVLVEQSLEGMRTDEAVLDKVLDFGSVKESSFSLLADIAASYKKFVRGELSAEENSKLLDTIKKFQDAEEISDTTMSTALFHFDQAVKQHDDDRLKSDVGGILDIMSSPGECFPFNDNALIVLDDYTNKPSSIFKSMFQDLNIPSFTPPFSLQQLKLIDAIHETAHATVKDRFPFNGGITPGNLDLSIVQPHETIAVNATVKFLDDLHLPESEQSILRYYHVLSFAGDISHDGVSFLRILKETGQQIDLDKFTEQKMQLLEKINAKTSETQSDTTGKKYVNVSFIMGAAQDILHEDKTLTPIQRAEIESFLEDAKAIGYTTDPNYPRRPEQFQSPQQTPAPPTPPQAALSFAAKPAA